MSKWSEIILIVISVCNLIFGIIIVSTPLDVKPITDPYINKIDSLEVELNYWKCKKDSVNNVIDSVNSYFYLIEKDYDETRNNIINNSVSEDYIFFSNYLNQNRSRLDSINNSKSVKGN